MATIIVTFEQIASALEAHAAAKQTVGYNDFADEVGLPRPNNFFANSALNAYFEQIDADDADEQRPFRTALVVQKRTGQPGAGFYKSLELHRTAAIPESNRVEVWKREIDELFDYYKPNQAPAKLQIELSRAQSNRLTRLCQQANRTPEILVASTLSRLLSFLEYDFALIQRADEDIQRGQVMSSEEMLERINNNFGRAPAPSSGHHR